MATLKDTSVKNLLVSENLTVNGNTTINGKDIETIIEDEIENKIKIYSGEVTNVGSKSWRDIRITFPEPFKVVPFVNILPTTLFSSENICLREVTTTGLVYSIYEQTDFTFGTRWMAIGY